MTVIRLADLIGSTVRDAGGERVGHVVDVVIDPHDDFALRELVVGTTGWLQRLDLRRGGSKRGRLHESDRIPWAWVDRIDGLTVHLRPGANEGA